MHERCLWLLRANLDGDPQKTERQWIRKSGRPESRPPLCWSYGRRSYASLWISTRPGKLKQMDEWIAGRWYLAVTCRNCGVEFAFQRDGEIDDSQYFTDSGRIVVTCPRLCSPHRLQRRTDQAHSAGVAAIESNIPRLSATYHSELSI